MSLFYCRVNGAGAAATVTKASQALRTSGVPAVVFSLLSSLALSLVLSACGGISSLEAEAIKEGLATQQLPVEKPVWPSLPVPIYIDSSFSSQQVSALEAAMGVWETAMGQKVFTLLSEKEGQASGASGLLRDENPSDFSPSASGITATSSIYAFTAWECSAQSGKLVSANIYFNDSAFFWTDTMALNESGSSSLPLADSQSIAIHELGHFFGLYHTNPSSEPNSVMNPDIPGEYGYAKRRPSLDDIETVRGLYGLDQSEQAAELSQQAETGIDSDTAAEVNAWDLAEACLQLLASNGAVPGGLYKTDKTLNSGVEVVVSWNCSSFPANVAPKDATTTTPSAAAPTVVAPTASITDPVAAVTYIPPE